MLTAALSIIAKTWKQPKYSPVDEWLNIHLLNVFSATAGDLPPPNRALKNIKVLMQHELTLNTLY